MITHNYIYDQNTLESAVRIMKRINRVNILCIPGFGAIAIFFFAHALYTALMVKGSWEFAIFEIAAYTVLGIGTLAVGIYLAKEPYISYSEANPADGYARQRRRYSGYSYTHYRSPERIFSYKKGNVLIKSEYAELDSDGIKGKTYSKTVKYKINKCRIYESGGIFLFYYNTHQNDAVPQSIFTNEELDNLRKSFIHSLRRKFVTLNK